MFGTLFLFLSKWPRELGMTCSLHDIKCIMFKTKILVDLPQMVAIGLKKKKLPSGEAGFCSTSFDTPTPKINWVHAPTP